MLRTETATWRGFIDGEGEASYTALRIAGQAFKLFNESFLNSEKNQ
ncbi:MAG: hypothetical protein HFH11_14200 [Dorea sp.]|nr:hypothetical protein [Dorea sp.]